MQPARLPPLLFCLALGGCGADHGAAVAPPRSAAAALVHSPPIGRLSDQQLRTLSMECEKYPVDKAARGPYDAAYCEAAMAAWSDAPLQMLPLKKE